MIGVILSLVNLFFFFFPPVEIAPVLLPYRVQIVILVPGVAVSLAVLAMRPTGIQKPQLALIIGLWFAICMSFLSKLQLRSTLFGFTEFIVPVCMYLLIAINANTPGRIRAICIAIFLCVFAMAIMGIFAYHTGYLEDSLIFARLGEGFQWVRRVRSFGTLNDPNDFAQVLVVGIGLAGVFWRKGRTPINLLFLTPVVAVMAYAIYLTGSRGAIFGLAMIAFVAISTRLGPMQSMLLAGAMAVVLVAGHFGGGRQITMQEERLTAWGSGIALLKSHPLFGIGYAQFTEHSDITAHNSFVLCFAELGLFGYFFWLALIIVSVLNLQRLTKLPVETPEQAKAARLVNPLRGAMFAYLMTGWFLSRTYNPVFYVLVALVGALIHVRKEADPKLTSAPLRWVPKTVAVQFASVILIYLTIRVRAF
jgi:O-antigen ligase